MKGRTVKRRTEERKEERIDKDRGLRRRKTMKRRREELVGEKRKVRTERKQ